MSVPPGYGDLGKNARDLFSKGFNYGKHNLEFKTKSESGIELKATANSNHDSGKFVGNLETKYKITDKNLTLKETWTTDNTLSAEIELMNAIDGLKLTTEGQFVPQSGKKSGKIKTNYKREYMNLSNDVNIDFAGPTINSSGVTEYNGWLLGFQLAFDTSKSQLSKTNFALGYKSGGTELTTTVNDGTDFGASVYHKVNDQTDFGTELSWTSGSNTTKFGIAAKYTLAPGSIYRAKVNNAMQLGFSYSHPCANGVSMTASTLLEGKNFNAGGHKIGFGLDFDL